MRIAVVDDDMEFLRRIEDGLKEFGRSTGEEMDVREFREGGGLLEDIAEKKNYDLYILDVEMPELDGLELARKIRVAEREANIVFLSNYEKYALPAYKVRACDYIMKDAYEREIPAVLNRVREEKLKESQEGFYLILTATTAEKLCFDDIVYLIKEKKYVIFHCMDGLCYRERAALEGIYRKLPGDRFIYINKGCVVNMKHVCGFREDVITMDTGGIKHTVSQKRIPTVWEQLREHWGKKKW